MARYRREVDDAARCPTLSAKAPPSSTPRLGGRVRHVQRYSEIVAVLVKHGFVDVGEALHLTPFLAAGRRVLAAFGRENGPDAGFINFGSALRTRADPLPSDIATLTRLQDDVALLPAEGAESPSIALGCALPELFAVPPTQQRVGGDAAAVPQIRVGMAADSPSF